MRLLLRSDRRAQSWRGRLHAPDHDLPGKLAAMITCLVVGDDPALREIVGASLERYGMQVRLAQSARAMRSQLDLGGIDLILLDLLLPDGNGIELCRKLRAHSEIPLILLSAESDPMTRIIGLEIGADDFVTKPQDCRELIARIRSLTRRTMGLRARTQMRASRLVPEYGSGAPWPARSTWNLSEPCGSGWRVYWRSRSLVTPQGMSIPLSNAEFQLLAAFALNPGVALSRKQLIQATQQVKGMVTERSVDLVVSRLRAKLGDSANTSRLIRTIRGCGYQLLPAGNLEFVSEQ